MFRFHSPDASSVERFINSQRDRKYSYCHQGKTATTPPEGFQVDHTRVKLGHGIDTFKRAKEALGKDFNIRAFHDVVLGAGSLPLDALEARVMDWIDSKTGPDTPADTL